MMRGDGNYYKNNKYQQITGQASAPVENNSFYFDLIQKQMMIIYECLQDAEDNQRYQFLCQKFSLSQESPWPLPVMLEPRETEDIIPML